MRGCYTVRIRVRIYLYIIRESTVIHDDCAVLLLSSCRSATTVSCYILLLTNLHVRAIALIGAAPLPGQTIELSGTRDKFYKSGTVPEIPEPMVLLRLRCLSTYVHDVYVYIYGNSLTSPPNVQHFTSYYECH